ncbi:MAG: hypothetical protein IH863_05020, partial [Chloroflexi bacterium]|nr:hypothetical protein [Chloroflexota bacterium]
MTTYAFSEEKAQAVLDIFEKHDELLTQHSQDMEGVDLAVFLLRPVPDVAFSGRLDGRLVLQGTLSRPRVRATLSSPRLFLGDEGIGALEANLVGAGDGTLSIDGTCRSGRVDLAVTGSVGTLPPYEVALHLSARDTSIDPFLRAVKPALPAVIGLVASGQMRLTGPLARPVELRAEASLSDLRLLLPAYPIESRGPVRLGRDGGRLRLADFHLAGEGTDLVVTGSADLLGDGPLSISVAGQADLRALSVVTRRLRGVGAARFAVEVTGTRSNLRLQGTLDFD